MQQVALTHHHPLTVMKSYGLLGQHLSHSHSPALHRLLGDYPYALIEKSPQELEPYLKEGDFAGLNVTIPYKKAVLPFMDELSPRARAAGSVNTILRRKDGTLFGENTDWRGFSYLLQASGGDPSGKKVLVLGSGGASQTVQGVLKELGARVTVISRRGPDHYGNLERHRDADWIINTTPVGMYPHNGEKPLQLEGFPDLSCVIDLIYNPLRTALLMEAEARGIPCQSGLPMLVAQAFYSSRLWNRTHRKGSQIPMLQEMLQSQLANIIYIGMPGSGKSTMARRAGDETGLPVYDSDKVFWEEEGLSPEEYIHQFGEEAFREKETKILARLGAMSGVIIATGGGAVTRPENYPLLHQNGTILWLKRPPEALDISAKPLFHRPDLETLYEERKALYEAWADKVIT